MYNTYMYIYNIKSHICVKDMRQMSCFINRLSAHFSHDPYLRDSIRILYTSQ